MKEDKPHEFRILQLITQEFAIIEQNFKNEIPAEVLTNLNFGAVEDFKVVGVGAKVQFVIDEQPFLIIHLEGQFQLNDRTWENLTKEQAGGILVPKELLTHFSMLVVGATRGALHVKLETTIFNKFVIPTINIQEQVKGDINVPFVELNK